MPSERIHRGQNSRLAGMLLVRNVRIEADVPELRGWGEGLHEIRNIQYWDTFTNQHRHT